ncbi:MAG: sigma factor-like helix-turn-helix DNA-binding protein [Bdellovibrionales bacterium]
MDGKPPKQKPWIGEKGQVLDKAALRQISKSWGPTNWEFYLSSLDGHQKECQASTNLIEESALAENIYPMFVPGCSPELSESMNRLLKSLTEKQKFVIEKIFFEGRSERQVARMMMISRTGVVDLKKRALRNLKNKAREALSKFPLVRAPAEKQTEVRESRKKGEMSC